MGVGIVVERGDLPVPRAAVEGDRLGQGSVGVEADGRGVGTGRVPLQLAEQPPAEPETSDLGGHPEPLDLGWSAPGQLQTAACHRLAVERGDEQEPRGRRELVGVDGVRGLIESAGKRCAISAT